MGKWREADCEGRKEDPRVEVHRVTGSPLFCLQRNKIIFPMSLEWKLGRETSVPEEEGALEPGGGLGLGQDHRRGRGRCGCR